MSALHKEWKAREAHPLAMALCRSIHGRWNYCPMAALPILGRDMQYGDGGYLCREACLDAAKHDQSIPPGATFADVTDWGPREPVVTLADRLKAAGFSVAQTGGGCTAWRAELANGAFVLLTDHNGADHNVTDTDALVIGLYDENGDPIAQAAEGSKP